METSYCKWTAPSHDPGYIAIFRGGDNPECVHFDGTIRNIDNGPAQDSKGYWKVIGKAEYERIKTRLTKKVQKSKKVRK